MANFYLVGAGHLAWHFSQVLQRAGHTVAVISRDPPHWPVTTLSYEEVAADAGAMIPLDAVFLTVADDAITTVSRRLSGMLEADLPLIHTSGATPTDRIDSYFRERGVLWPIRSLRRGEPIADWNDLPLVYDGSSPALRRSLRELAGELSSLTYRLDNEQRAHLHLAAVFSNNFVTWMYQIAYELCAERDIPFAALLPIIRNTALAQDGQPPRRRQTGAAARGDVATLQRHLSLLEDPAYRVLYQKMSELIRAGVTKS